MADQEYVIFTLRGARYGIETSGVREIVSLPELTPIAEAPPHIAGVVNVRGTIVPVIDLAVRLGMPPRERSVSDTVILFHHDGRSFGAIVDGVHEVRVVAERSVEPVPSFGFGTGGSGAGSAGSGPNRFVIGLAKVDDGLVSLLSIDALVGSADGVTPGDAATDAPPLLGEGETRQLARIAPSELGIFRERAEALRLAPASEEMAGFLSMALFRLGEEYFAAKLDLIREFTDIVDPTPVPCSPPHIVGQMNLRGDILTLVDIRPALRMPTVDPGPTSKVIVLDLPELRAGVVADEVIDVVAIAPGAVAPLPAAVQPPVDDYITGIVHHGASVVAILDLATIFSHGELDVEEEV